MAGKTLNAKNLQALGTERLAELVMTLVQGSAPLKREARAALLEASGTEALATEVRKRLATIRRSRSYISWRKRKTFLRDLTNQRDIITTRIAPDNPKTAYDLLWQFLETASPVIDRTGGDLEEILMLYDDACPHLNEIALNAKIEPVALAERVFTTVTGDGAFGIFRELIPKLQEALGEAGLNTLTQHYTAALDDPVWDGDAVLRIGLMQLADLAGDADAYAAQFEPEMRRMPKVAAKIAFRLLKAGRPGEALALLDGADHDERRPPEWTRARIDALDALELGDEAQDMRWRAFKASLNGEYLREHLQRLPDFDDVEAEERALNYVTGEHGFDRALSFLITWPDHDRAAALILAQLGTINGGSYFLLAPAADALEAKQPLAATILRRAMIEDTLNGGKSKRYKHAARHMLECESADAVIDDYGPLNSHEAFVSGLRERHGRKYAFWDLV